jgi:hypothetical protein
MPSSLLRAISVSHWLNASRSGASNDWRWAAKQWITGGVLRIDKAEWSKLIGEIKNADDCNRPEARAKLREFFAQLLQSDYGQGVEIEFVDTDLDIVYPGFGDPEEDIDTADNTASETETAQPEGNAPPAQAAIASSGIKILGESRPSAKASSAQTLAALAIANALRAIALFSGLRLPQLGPTMKDATVELGADQTLVAVGFEPQRSIAARLAATIGSPEALDFSIAFDNSVSVNIGVNVGVQLPHLLDAALIERVQIAAIPKGLLGSKVSFEQFESPPAAELMQLSNAKLAQSLPALGQPQDLNPLGGSLESPIAISWRENSGPNPWSNSPVTQTLADPNVDPQDKPLVSPVEKPGDRPLDANKLAPIVEPRVPDEGPIGPELPMPEPLAPVIDNPEFPVDVDLPGPVEIDLPKDTPTTVVIPSDRPVIEISGFVGVGRGSSPSAQRVLEADTLQFTGSGQIARYLQMEQRNQDVVITFEGNDLVNVVLKNVSLDEIDNLDPLTGASAKVGNIIFAGETTTSDSFDVFNSDWYRNTLLNPNTTTFLNDLDNFVYGFDNSDDVINGQGGNDLLFGLGGNDLLRGGSGDDILNGGLGHNQLVGNSGKDTFVITPGGLSDVMDFTLGTDKIQLAQGTTYDRLTLTNFTEGNRGGTQVWQGNQLVLRVFGVTANQLTSEQFVPGQNDRLP